MSERDEQWFDEFWEAIGDKVQCDNPEVALRAVQLLAGLLDNEVMQREGDRLQDGDGGYNRLEMDPEDQLLVRLIENAVTAATLAGIEPKPERDQ